MLSLTLCQVWVIGMHDIIIIKISPKNSGVLINGISTAVTVK